MMFDLFLSAAVIPAHAGIRLDLTRFVCNPIPACAGMTEGE